ncbi:MAG: hypothetical protein IKL51_02890 [Lachnospiraceae bacterium]|nr:hypothetical protein [Lachnospiraceae bacterium]
MKRITKKGIWIVLLLFFITSLIPILGLSFYNFPCADDFSASDDVRLAWINSGSIIALFKAAWDNVVFNYKEWSGVYMSVFWTSLQPAIFGEKYYFISNWFTLGLLVFSVMYFCHVISQKYITGKKYDFRIVAVLYLFVIIQCMPDGNEGIFWHAGAANYTWAFCFLMILIGIILSVKKEKSKAWKYSKIVISFILSIFVGGGNYLTALQGVLWMTFLLVILLLLDKEKKEWREKITNIYYILMPLLVMSLSFLISVLAPGNSDRMLEATGMNPVKAILLSCYYWPELVIKEWISWPVILIILLAIPFLYDIAKEVDYDFKYPGFIILISLGFATACLTPNLYAQSDVGGGRTWNICFLVLLFWVFCDLFYIMGWFSTVFQKKEEKVIWKKYILYLMIIGIGFGVLCTRIDKETFMATEAWDEISSGRAEFYRYEWEERIKLYYDDSIENVVVKRFTAPPQLLLFEDNVPHPGEWINLVVAKYYEKETVQSE